MLETNRSSLSGDSADKLKQSDVVRPFEGKEAEGSLGVDSSAGKGSRLVGEELRTSSDPPTPMSAVAYSESNLLSECHHSSYKKQTSKVMSISPCMEVRVGWDYEQQGSESEGLFHLPEEPAKFSEQELSFEVQDSDRRRLKELEFEFDQLVRQELVLMRLCSWRVTLERRR